MKSSEASGPTDSTRPGSNNASTNKGTIVGRRKVPPPRIAPLVPSPVYDTYWKFAAERQRVFFRRIIGEGPPWTEDPIIQVFKFTNVYRASDRVSQYLIKNVIYRDDLPTSPNEVVFRILLFKVFNRIETWELLEGSLGSVTFDEFAFERYDEILTQAMSRGEKIYSAAYIMPSGGSLGYNRKHRNHLALIERMMADDLPARLGEARSMQKAFDLLHAYPTIGDFLAYQYVTDLNYSTVTNFTEMEFVVPGPGAVDGIRKCFKDTGGLSQSEIIKFMVDRQEIEFERLSLDFHNLWGRRLQLIDSQNLFCEVGKYARVHHPDIGGVSGRTRIKQKFRQESKPIPYWYPPKWGINDAVARTLASASKWPYERTLFSLQDEPMDLHTYQSRAEKTDRNPTVELTDQKAMMIPLLGLAGEAGELLSEYKKYLRDGDSHLLFRERFAEELGDLLWYLANTATKFGLNLEEIASQNLAKCEQRFGASASGAPFDVEFPETEQLPRQIQIDFNTVHDQDDKPKMLAYYKGEPFGDPLTDNAYERDGYRFHDVFHLAFAAVLGWSPITRSLLKRKRRSRSEVDEVEDGGRAKAIEEGISALIFAFGKEYGWLEGKGSVSSELLRTVRSMTSHLEVSCRTAGDWESAILQGFTVWREIKRRGGGTVVADLDKKTLTFKGG